MLWTLSSLLLIILSVLTWYRFAYVKQVAFTLAKRYCEQNNVDLLDDTVTLKKTTLTRDHDGRICFKRVYRLSYYDSVKQQSREHSIVMLGLQEQKSFQPQFNDNIINFSDYKK